MLHARRRFELVHPGRLLSLDRGYHAHNLLDESGPLFTLGYTRSWGDQRIRAEFFGGVVQYTGGAQFSNGTTVPLSNHTAYYGGRAEWDLFCNPANHPRIQIFIGLGTRVGIAICPAR